MPLSQQDLSNLVHAVNTTPETVDVSIKPLHATGFNPRGPLLYPCSGADVCFPLLMFPEINEFVLVDEHPFLLPENDLNYKHLNELNQIKLETGFGFWGEGYDYTNLNEMLHIGHEDLIDLRWVSADIVGTVLLLRLKKLVGMDLLAIKEEVPGKVYKIEGNVNGKLKTIYYVQHKFGDYSEAYQWLQNQAFNFRTIFVKAFSVSIGECINFTPAVFNQIRNLLDLSAADFSVITEKFNDYRYNQWIPNLFNPQEIREPLDEQGNSIKYDCFGYNDCLVVGNANAVYRDYPTHIDEKRQKATELEKQKILEEKRKEEEERNEVARVAIMEPQDQIKYLHKIGYIVVENETLILKCQGTALFYKVFPDRRDFFLNNIIKAIFLYAKERGVQTLQFLMSVIKSHQYQVIPKYFIEQLDINGKHIKNLQIKADSQDELKYLSDYSVDAATELARHGRFLETFDVSVNDKGAKAFAETALILGRRYDACLKATNITPIKQWNSVGQDAVNKMKEVFVAEKIDKHTTPSKEDLLLKLRSLNRNLDDLCKNIENLKAYAERMKQPRIKDLADYLLDCLKDQCMVHFLENDNHNFWRLKANLIENIENRKSDLQYHSSKDNLNILVFNALFCLTGLGFIALLTRAILINCIDKEKNSSPINKYAFFVEKTEGEKIAENITGSLQYLSQTDISIKN